MLSLYNRVNRRRSGAIGFVVYLYICGLLQKVYVADFHVNWTDASAVIYVMEKFLSAGRDNQVYAVAEDDFETSVFIPRLLSSTHISMIDNRLAATATENCG